MGKRLKHRSWLWPVKKTSNHHEFLGLGRRKQQKVESGRLHSTTSTGTGSKSGAWLAVPITRAVRSAPETSSYLAGIFSLSLKRR
jgi:hypothetical protein